MQQRFDDRFTHNNNVLAASDIDALTDEELELISPDFADYAAQVRRHSVVLGRRATPKLIYRIATEDSDPRIALRLAAGRYRDNTRIFPSMEAVKEAMFGPPSNNSETFLNASRNIFVGGIRRVSAALTASRLIGQLAQVEEQAKHANVLEAQALADLKEILYSFEIDSSLTRSDEDLASSVPALFFEPTTINLDPLNSTLKVEVYVPEGVVTGWNLVREYDSPTSTGDIAADIANALNSLALVSESSNVLVAPILASKESLHKLEFQARKKDPTIAFEVVTIRVTSSDGRVPFKWGVDSASLKNERINSVLISVANGRATYARTSSASDGPLNRKQPTVLYFRRTKFGENTNKPIPPREAYQSTQVRFRISPSMSEFKSVSFITPTVADPILQAKLDAQRPGRLAELIWEGLVQIKAETSALGALIRNDDPESINLATPLSALELVAYSVTDPEAWLILDVADLPIDVEMATGNVFEPLTPFSTMPRSIRVESTLDRSKNGGLDGGAGGNSSTYNGEPLLQRLPPSAFLASVNERVRHQRSYRRSGLIGYDHYPHHLH